MALNKYNKGLLLFDFAILYFYIYNPMLRPGIAIGGTILIFISLLYTIKSFAIVSKFLKYYKKELALSIIITIYVTIICVLNGEDFSLITKDLVVWIICSSIVPIFLVNTIVCRYKNIAFWDIILEIGFIASLLSCFALFVPPFNDFLRSIQVEIDTTGDSLEEQLDFRCFGFAFYLTSRYGYVQGLMASLSLLRLDSSHKRYAFYFLTFFLSVIVNARTGLFPIGMTLLYLLSRTVIKIKIITLLKMGLAGLIGGALLIKIFNAIPDILDFFLDFFDQLSFMFVEGQLEDSGYSKMFFLPETMTGFIFGEGRRAVGIMDRSDIGYVNQIFYGGIIFAGSLVLYEYMVFRKVLKWSKERIFAAIFFISMFIFNYKGAWFADGLSAFVRLWMLYYFVLVHNKIEPNKIVRLS